MFVVIFIGVFFISLSISTTFALFFLRNYTRKVRKISSATFFFANNRIIFFLTNFCGSVFLSYFSKFHWHWQKIELFIFWSYNDKFAGWFRPFKLFKSYFHSIFHESWEGGFFCSFCLKFFLMTENKICVILIFILDANIWFLFPRLKRRSKIEFECWFTFFFV